ncbi:MAG: glycosyltransferase [Pseudomonadota bacterium]
MFITNSNVAAPRGGRALLSALHWRALQDVVGDTIRLQFMTGHSTALRATWGYIDGVTPDTIADLIAMIERDHVAFVWLDGSNFGTLAAAIRQRAPSVVILTFFHNVETRFFLGLVRYAPALRALAVLLANYLAERRAVRSSDRLIALSERDSAALARLYGKSATDIAPMAVEDVVPEAHPHAEPLAPDAPLIFVGGSFYANLAGMRWFAERVAPRIAADAQVIGYGMEVLRAELSKYPNIEVVGPVDHLDVSYRSACAAIAPIFDGSGMKTKVAEALMYGRPIVGTSEAFSGYEAVAGQAGWVCDTAEEFVSAVAIAKATSLTSFDPALRALYEKFYSPAALRHRLVDILAAAGLMSPGPSLTQ